MSSQREMQLTLQSLGIDIDTTGWQDLAYCSSIDIDLLQGKDDIFFDKYEKDVNTRKQTDQICLSCPVTSECFEYGQSEGLTGVFGGFWLTNGEVDESRNNHKSPELVKLLSKRIFGDYV